MATKSKVPQIRFRGFSGEWEKKSLYQIIDLCSGRDYKHLKSGSIPVYGTGGYMLSVNEALSSDKDAIGIGRKGTIDKPYILKAPFWTVDTLFYAIPQKENYLTFVYSIFQRINWKQKDESTGVPSLSKIAINNIQVFTCKENEQTKIGDYFQKLDKLIKQKEKKYQKLKQFKKAMLSKMFPKNGADTPEIRFCGFSGRWDTKELGDIGTVAMNKRIFKNQTTEKGDIPFYKIGTFGGKADAFISRQLFEDYKSKYPYPKEGDLLISASGSIGRIVEYIGKDEYFQDSNIVWLKHENQLENSFLKQFYKVVKWNGLEGSTIQRLYNKNILETQISFPMQRDEQTKIGSYFQKLDKQIELQIEELEKLKNIKKASLSKMFV